MHSYEVTSATPEWAFSEKAVHSGPNLAAAVAVVSAETGWLQDDQKNVK